MSEEKKLEVSPEGMISKQEKYTVSVKYSPEAIQKKLIKFQTPSGDEFEISADEIVSLLVNQVNQELLAPVFVETERVNVVQIQRQIKFRFDNDVKAGTEMNIPYIHPYPIEYAILEEAYKIAKIDLGRGVMELTKDFIDEVKVKMEPNLPNMEKFTKNFYKSFKSLDLEPEAKKN